MEAHFVVKLSINCSHHGQVEAVSGRTSPIWKLSAQVIAILSGGALQRSFLHRPVSVNIFPPQLLAAPSQQDLELLNLPPQQLRKDLDAEPVEAVHQVDVAEHAGFPQHFVPRPRTDGHFEVQPPDVDEPRVVHLLHHKVRVTRAA